ncbi:MAG: hypothetical protein ACK50Q_00460 [Labrys sp. (in: a-proteobacteria)]
MDQSIRLRLQSIDLAVHDQAPMLKRLQRCVDGVEPVTDLIEADPSANDFPEALTHTTHVCNPSTAQSPF